MFLINYKIGKHLHKFFFNICYTYTYIYIYFEELEISEIIISSAWELHICGLGSFSIWSRTSGSNIALYGSCLAKRFLLFIVLFMISTMAKSPLPYIHFISLGISSFLQDMRIFKTAIQKYCTFFF